MYVKIDTDILETILKAYARRQKHQIRIYGVLLGTLDGKDTFNVKNTLINYIYEDEDQNPTSGVTKVNFSLYSSQGLMILFLRIFLETILRTSLIMLYLADSLLIKSYLMIYIYYSILLMTFTQSILQIRTNSFY
jgi:hypothetical protein